MFRNLAEDIAFLLIKNKIVDIEKREIYIYGLEVILLNGGLLIAQVISTVKWYDTMQGAHTIFCSYMNCSLHCCP